ncbi:transmembrane emp24 domain-containing protein 10-like [Epinephelus moara]|uniref:transmembrane emp24 domain-containing protein 10-like n=1 Tax=Epinephelus moara TaxID=300413 RepID=UPI00214E15B5|nr:transmembrane emp24 domain-containing protein 10-like [Epinephelus moara]
MTRNWREETEVGAGAACDRSSSIIILHTHYNKETNSMNTVFLLIPVLLLDPVVSITFYLPANSWKCLQDDIHKNVLVSGEYEVSEDPHTVTDLRITDSLGGRLYNKDNATKGKFSFVTQNHDQFDVCFSSTAPLGSGRVKDQVITLNVKHGVDAKGYEEIEKLEKRTPLEAQLRHLERLSQSIADDFILLKERVRDVRQTNESTNESVQLFSILSICCFLALATWQIFYLRRFFKIKKLIE